MHLLLRTDAKVLSDASYLKTHLVRSLSDGQDWMPIFAFVQPGPQHPFTVQTSQNTRRTCDLPENRAFMGSRPPCEVHHDHHPLRSTATRRALGTFTQDAGALACYPHRVTVHPAAWQGHLPTVRHQDRRKRMPGVIDYRVLQAHQTVRAAIGRRAMLTAVMAMTQ